MVKRTQWESISVQSGEILNQVRNLIHEGNVRRIVITREGKTLVDFSLTVGVIGTTFLPALAAVGVVAPKPVRAALELGKTSRITGSPTPPAQEPNSDRASTFGLAIWLRNDSVRTDTSDESE